MSTWKPLDAGIAMAEFNQPSYSLFVPEFIYPIMLRYLFQLMGNHFILKEKVSMIFPRLTLLFSLKPLWWIYMPGARYIRFFAKLHDGFMFADEIRINPCRVQQTAHVRISA
jgi:hypothetical protein